jgi:hypothetical protein
LRPQPDLLSLADGLIERDEKGFRFPYDAAHVDFLLKAT